MTESEKMKPEELNRVTCIGCGEADAIFDNGYHCDDCFKKYQELVADYSKPPGKSRFDGPPAPSLDASWERWIKDRGFIVDTTETRTAWVVNADDLRARLASLSQPMAAALALYPVADPRLCDAVLFLLRATRKLRGDPLRDAILEWITRHNLQGSPLREPVRAAAVIPVERLREAIATWENYGGIGGEQMERCRQKIEQLIEEASK